MAGAPAAFGNERPVRRGTGKGIKMSEYVKGTHPRELPRPNRTFEEGRVCAHESCETRLSIYNRSPSCWQHTPVRFPFVRGQRKRKAA